MSEYKNQLAAELVERYRDLIDRRYQYDILSKRVTLPDTISHPIVEELRAYFLQYIYPSLEKRNQLDEAFSTLGSFVKEPIKIWSLIGSMTSAIFKFGTLLPQALRAGLNSWQAFIDARNFEQALLKAGIDQAIVLPLQEKHFYECVASLPRKKLENFIEDTCSLFINLTNTELVEKTISIMISVIERMKKSPKVYTEIDIKGIELGVEILKEGYTIFSKLDKKLKTQIVLTIRQNELLFLDEVFGSQAVQT